MGSKTFYSLFLSFFVGVFVASHIEISVLLIFLFLGSLFCILFTKKNLILYFFCIIFFCFGVYRLEISKTNIHFLDQKVGTKVELRGFVSSEPENKNTGQKFRFKIDEQRDQVIVSTSFYPKYKYGDVLIVSGNLKLPKNFESYPGGPEFDYISYLAKDDIRYTISRPEILSISENVGNTVISILIKIKQAFMRNVEKNMPEPHASLVAGILLGEKSSLPDELKEDFRRSGLTHILVLSGSNVSVVASTLMTVFSFLPRILGQSLGVFSIILFALMTGASATTIRASIMALIVILSRQSGRDYNVSRALLIAAFLMLIVNPRILVWDIGFQLSFLSTLALVYVSPIVSEKIQRITDKFQLREILSTTISTQFFVLPFMLYSMGEVSVISLITNLLVLPIVPLAMFFGFTVGISGFFGYIITLPFAWVSDLLLSWMILVVRFFGELPFASIKITIGKLLLISVYVVYIIFIYRWRQKNFSRPFAN